MFYLKETNEKELNIDKNKEFVAGQFLQSFAWSKFNDKLKQKNFRIIIKRSKNNKIVGKSLFIIKKVKGILRYAYCPYGPTLSKNLNQKEIDKIFELFIKHLKKYKIHFLRFNPPIPKKEKFNIPGLQISKAKTKQPEQTLYLDLSKNQKDLLAEMKSKTRYNIKLSEKKGVTIKKGISKKMIAEFLELSKITGERDRFRNHSNIYFKKLISSLKKEKLLKIYTSYYNEQALASNLIIFYNNTATYLHGASSNFHRNLMPTYALQWKAICEAKKKRFKYYDFWGFDKDKWPGVSRFKEGFGGQKIQFHPTYEIAINKPVYFLYKIIRFVL